MPLDKLVERILSDARAQAERLLGEAQKEKKEILASAKREAEGRFSRKLNAISREAEEEKKQRVTMGSLDSRNEILAEKQVLMQEVFDRALQSIVELPAFDYLAMMVKSLVEVTRERGGEVLLSPRDRERVGEDLVNRANAELSKSGKEGLLTLAGETREISGGFILRSEGVEVNNSIEAQINSRREELEPRVVEILFGDGGNGL